MAAPRGLFKFALTYFSSFMQPELIRHSSNELVLVEFVPLHVYVYISAPGHLNDLM